MRESPSFLNSSKPVEAEVKPRFAQLANFEREHLEIPAGVERQGLGDREEAVGEP